MAERPSIGEYIQVLSSTVPRMAAQIGELAKAELKPTLKHGGIGTGAFIVAAVLGLLVLQLFVLTFGFFFSMIFHELVNRHPLTALTLGFLTWAVLLLILVAAIAFIGWRQVKQVKAPSATIAETKASIGAISNAIQHGVTDAERRVLALTVQATTATFPQRRSSGL